VSWGTPEVTQLSFVGVHSRLMLSNTRRRHPKPDRERALTLLAGSPEGVPEAVMTVAHGYTVEQLAALVQAGLATACMRRMRGRNTLAIAVTWLTITDAGLAARTAMRAGA